MIPAFVITHLIAAGAAGLAAYSWQANHYQATIAEIKQQQALAALRAAEISTRHTQDLQDAKDKALAKATQRHADASRAAAAVRTERDRLRDDLAAARLQLPDASCSTIREHASTLNTVFDRCTARLEQMARDAQGHAIDSLMFQEAWPTNRAEQ